jgi:gliding motility-associated-like protein
VNTSNALITVNTTPATVTINDNDANIIATNDPFTIECTTNGLLGNLLTNDTVSGNLATLTNVQLTINTNPLPTNIAIDAIGNITTTSGMVAGTYTINYTISEVGNLLNFDQGEITILVTDTTPPVWVTPNPLPTSIEIACDEILPPYVITGNEATDTCGTVTIVQNADVRVDGNCPNSYTLIRTWTATDQAGLTSVPWTQTIIVADTEPPVPSAATPFDETPIPVTCDAIRPFPTIVYEDKCSGTVNVSDVVETISPIVINGTNGTYQIIRKQNATDVCGNFKDYIQTINVTIPNYYQEVLLFENCNIANEEVDLLTVVKTKYPSTLDTGMWSSVDSGILGTSFDAANGTFNPYHVAVGDYSILYQISDPTCPKVIEIKLKVDDDCTVDDCQTLDVKNAFSPNGDFLNETFQIIGIDTDCYRNNTLEIYNRWGIKVYEKENYDNITEPFNGLSDGRSTIKKNEELPVGTYFYILQYKSIDGNTYKKDGYLYLNR